jgi:hypothetical protein
MEYDHEKVDEVVLALLTLTMFKDGAEMRAWKGHDWEVLDRLYDQGYIFDPKNKAKSVVLSEEGAKKSKELFVRHFGING